MKFRHLFVAGLISVSVPAVFAADSGTNEPVTVTINSTTGSFTAGSGNFRSQWTLTSTPGVVLDCGANNFLNNVTGDLQYFVGTNRNSTVSITSKTGAYYVSAISFKAKLVSDGNIQVGLNGSTKVTLTSDYKDFSATNIAKGTECGIQTSGDNKGFYLSEFKITLTPDPDYVDVPYRMCTTTIENGEFAAGTIWYNLQMTLGKYSLAANGDKQIDLTVEHADYQGDEIHQWCFVKQNDGTYKIYNRAEGTGKLLAAPKGGTAFPRMMAEGNSDYCYTWNIKKAEQQSNGSNVDNAYAGKYPFYLVLSDNPNAVLNNFAGAGKLDFWTGGYDNGSVIVPYIVEGTFAVNLETGYLVRADEIDHSNRWQNRWVHNANTGIKFGTDKNNMTTTTGDVTSGDIQLASGGTSCGYTFTFANTDYYVSALSFNAAMSSANGSATLGVGSQSFRISGTEPHPFRLDGLGNGDVSGITVTAANDLDNNVVITDMVVSVKRTVRVFVDGINLFPRNATNCMRRIPAIAVTGKTGRLIAVYDLRHHNGDLGGASNIDLQIVTSDDNGATWTSPDFAYGADGKPVTKHNDKWTRGGGYSNDYITSHAVDAWDSAWGDAAIVGDRESDKVLMVAVGGPIGFFASRRDNTQSAIRWTSMDGGKTWSEPDNITEKIYSLFDGEPRNQKIDGMFFGSGRMCQSRHVKVGEYYRIYSAISSQNEGSNTRNFVVYTDDFGESWHLLGGKEVWPTEGNSDEPKVEELPDGSVILSARTRWGNRNFAIFRYTNPTTGEGRWGDAITTNMGMGNINACNGEIYILPVRNIETQQKCFMALQSFPFGGSRAMVSIAWKPLAAATDFNDVSAFHSWNGRYQVCAGGHESTYSTMVLTHDGQIAFFYEENLNGLLDGIFKKLSIETITDGKYEYCPDRNNEIAQELTGALVELRTNSASGDNAEAIDEAGMNYLGEPSYANYIALNRAEYGYTGDADAYDFDYSTPMWPGLDDAAELEAIEVEPSEVSIGVGGTVTLSVKVTPAEAQLGNVAWSSSDETVATVSASGVVTGVKEGTATITATCDTLTAACIVTVAGQSGISEIATQGDKTVIYDLQGRKVLAPAKGLYIVNGHKSVIK